MDSILLSKLISIPSTFPKEKDLSIYVKKWLDDNSAGSSKIIKVEPNRNMIVATKGHGKKTVLLVGHLDTVPVVDGWKTEPHLATISQGNLYGLGAWDMKSGLSIIMEVFSEFKPKNISLKVAFTVDEENYSIGAHKLVDSGFCKDIDFVMVPEPGFIHGEKGITVGRSGRATYLVKIKGISAHGSFPEQGTNAIDQALIFLKLIERLKLSANKELGTSTLFPRLIKSEAKGFSVPDECYLEIDSKLIAPDQPENVLKKMQKVSNKFYTDKKLIFKPEISYKQRPTPFCSPYQTPKNDPYVLTCQHIIDQLFGNATVFYRNSVADECIYANRLNIPTVTIGPNGGNAHQANEYVNLKSLSNTKKIYLSILKNIDSN